ncbi:MAG: DUF4190 domain-containing protein [Flavobacteriales bacterium]|nr:DUF4190 domain-containing protein [Flavobacteriales bacterium]
MSESDDLLDPGVTQSAPTGGYAPQKVIPNANTVLVLGIISIVGCILYAIPGLVCGVIALVMYKKVKATYLSDKPAYEASFKNAKAGYVCAIIGTILSGLFFLYVIFVLIIFATAASGGFGRF